MSEQRLREELAEARKKLLEQDELLQQLTAQPISHATVLGHVNGGVLIVSDGKILEVNKPRDFEVTPGQIVKIAAMTGQIFELSEVPHLGSICIVEHVPHEGVAEVDVAGTRQTVIFDTRIHEVRKNDRVVLDRTGYVILENKGADKSRHNISETNIDWDDVGGLWGPKEEMVDAIELPFRRPDVFKFYNKRLIKGLLLYGPPGCGKTLLGRAAATSLAQVHAEEETSSGFLYVKGPEILDKYVGVAEHNIRNLFERARRFKEEFGFPAVLFIDEADAILAKRGSGVSSDMEKTIVPQFLSEMDGMEESSALVILATNRADVLDPAVIREGRVDRKIKIPRPDLDSAIQIFEVHLKDLPFKQKVETSEVARASAELLYSDDTTMYRIHIKAGEPLNFNLGAISSGAMIEGIVDRATSIAIKRELKRPRGRLEGLDVKDIRTSIYDLLAESKQRAHKEEIEVFAESHRQDVVDIERVG